MNYLHISMPLPVYARNCAIRLDHGFSSPAVKCVLWPTGKRTTREQSKSCRLYSARAAPPLSYHTGISTPPDQLPVQCICLLSIVTETVWNSRNLPNPLPQHVTTMCRKNWCGSFGICPVNHISCNFSHMKTLLFSLLRRNSMRLARSNLINYTFQYSC